ncbi:schlafen-like protein 1 [Mytilus californianus]|uniref:schlafen-like protein 1 n=1 Tax=Mytilus californianus TaxID=6549 RepID=UPI0022470976|nr:schlafen-like protein 1 [Mytilus californianus]
MASSSPYNSTYDNRIHSKRPANRYDFKQILGDETRYTEFKKGGGNIEKNFLKTGHKKCLAHYACAFINNMEEGAIYIGVNDKGKVVGLKCDHEKRDRIRIKITQVLQNDLEPPLNTIHYSVDFVPVYKTDEHHKDDIFVLEITFYPVDRFDKLYRVNGEVYAKFDGCISKPLERKRIQDWEDQIRNKQRNNDLQEKMKKYESEKAENERIYKQLIAEKGDKDNEIIEEKRLRLENEKQIYSLQREKSELVKQNKTLIQKSKVCVIL